VVVIGASGFIGEHLLALLANRTDIEVRVLVHRKRAESRAGITFVEGNLLAPESLDALLSKDCTVINLAYLARDNLQAMSNLAGACARQQVRRLIHCSTAVVAGRAKGDLVTETTLCRPTTEYEQTKLQIETLLLEATGKFEVAILRPTAVFGAGGKNLLKLANELTTGNRWINYLRSCLFAHRSMNLVCVENVVAALAFLLDAGKTGNDIFIISDDDSPANNYRDVEDRLLVRFGKSYPLPRVSLPGFILGALLWLSGKPNINPSLRYSDRKLVALGLIKPQRLEAAIDAFAGWYKNAGKTHSAERVV
jgi:nucleoside-diphosphate-sugar epimerase